MNIFQPAASGGSAPITASVMISPSTPLTSSTEMKYV